MATQRNKVTELLKDQFENARLQLAGLEKKTLGEAKKTFGQAKKSFDEVQKSIDEVPQQLKGAWEQVVVRFRSALDYASREELAELAEKVDDLAKKVDKLLRGEKIRSSAEKKDPRNGKKA
jgi:polyhydroxyalkanoate synthesis regulator phasin